MSRTYGPGRIWTDGRRGECREDGWNGWKDGRTDGLT